MKNEENDKKALSLTMQQKFNFDLNSFDEEDTKKYKRNQNSINKIKMNKRMKEIIDIKNKYKRKYNITLCLLIIVVFLFLITIFTFTQKNIYSNKKDASRKTELLLDENIVFLGDSITELYDVHSYYKNYHVVNSGQGGNTTYNILDNLEKRVYQYNPSKVFLLIGTNDMANQYPKEETYINITKIVSEIKKKRPCTKIYVESIYPINNSNDSKISRKSVTYRSNETINYINKKLKKKYEKSDVTFIDVNKQLLDKDNLLNINYTVDGVHISKEGYKKITSILLPYIKE